MYEVLEYDLRNEVFTEINNITKKITKMISQEF